MNARELLGKSTFFADVLDGADLDALALVAWREDFDRGAVLMRERERGNSLFVIARGTVNVSISGRAQTVATLGPGSVVGEMSLLTGAPRSATVTALMPVSAYRIGKDQLQPILDRRPILYERFAAMVEKRKADLEQVYGPGLDKAFLTSRAQFVAAMRAFFGKSG